MTLARSEAYPVNVFVQMLRTLDHVLDVASTTSDQPDRLARARLAPDMFDLGQHVELTCRHAVEAMGHLGAALDELSFPEREGLAGLRLGVARAIGLLEGGEAVGDDAFEAQVIVETTTGQTFRMSGRTMLNDWSIPQFYFHLVTVYAILRAQGVQLGIRDFLGHMGRHLSRG